MKGFVELNYSETMVIYGGKDTAVAKTVELLGFAIGWLVRSFMHIFYPPAHIQRFIL